MGIRGGTFIVWLWVALWPGLAMGANHYVRAGASGGQNGSDWTNAWTALPATLARGDTYYIGDGEYGGYTFNDAVSGTSVITIRKAVAADHGTDTGWNEGYGDGQAVFHAASGNGWTITTGYWVFDGQVGGGPGSWNSGHGFRVIGAGGLSVYSVRLGTSVAGSKQPDRIELRHVDMGGESVEVPDRCALYEQATAKGLGSEHVTITQCYLHNANFLMLGFYGKYWLIEYNYFFRNWTEPTHHGEAIADRGNDNVVVRYNWFSDIDGTCFIALKKNEDQQHDYWDIYGNVFFFTEGNPWQPGGGMGGNGSVGMTDTATGTSNHILVYNNTFVNVPGLNTGVYLNLGTGNEVFNNVWYVCDKISHINVEHDYNDYFTTPFAYTTEPSAHDTVTTGAASPFVNWPAGNFGLTSATAAGVEVSSSYNTSWTSATLDVDMFGKTRGGDGVWDRGAIEYVASDTEAPSVPGGLTAGVVSSSEIGLTWTAATDNVGVEYYRIGRGGTSLTTTTQTSYADPGLTASTSYTYQVRAYDFAGNASAYSAGVAATTNAAFTTSTVLVVYWEVSSPTLRLAMRGTIHTLAFVAGHEQEAGFSFRVPAGAATVRPEVICVARGEPDESDLGAASWGIEYVLIGPNLGSAQTRTSATRSIGVNGVEIVGFGAVDVGGASWVSGRVYRDGTAMGDSLGRNGYVAGFGYWRGDAWTEVPLETRLPTATVGRTP